MSTATLRHIFFCHKTDITFIPSWVKIKALWFIQDNNRGGLLKFFFRASVLFSFHQDELAAPSALFKASSLITELDSVQPLCRRRCDHPSRLPYSAQSQQVALWRRLQPVWQRYWPAAADVRRCSAEYQWRPHRRSGRIWWAGLMFRIDLQCFVLFFFLPKASLLHHSQ